MLISIIIPVYNSEKFLKACINSILCQSYKNFEIILIDDGSTDNSAKICDEFAKLDSRVVVVHKQNGGVSSARNKGLEIARGEYLTFVDNDDVLPENALELYVNALKKEKALVLQGNILVSKNIEQTLNDTNCDNKVKEEIKIMNPADFAQDFNNKTFVWSKLYQTELARSYKFIEGHYGEDLFFNGLILSDHRVDKIIVIPDIVYIWFDNGESASRNWRVKEFVDVYKIVNSLYFEIKKRTNNSKLSCAYLKTALTQYAAYKYSIVLWNEYSGATKSLFKSMKKELIKELLNSELSIINKLLYTVLVNVNSLYRVYILHKDPSVRIYEKEVKKQLKES